MVEPGQYARIVEMEDTLKAKQAAVGGGLITCAYPWEEAVCIVANDEGLINGMPFNRYVENYQVIAGPFFVCGFTEDDFCSLTDDQAERYCAMFQRPELFLYLEDGLLWIPYDNPHLPGAPEEVAQRFAQHGDLPDQCFCASPDDDVLAIIHYGEYGCCPIVLEPDMRHPEETVDKLNAVLGITQEQQAAMLYGSINGWDFSAPDHAESPDQLDALEEANPHPGVEMDLTT